MFNKIQRIRNLSVCIGMIGLCTTAQANIGDSILPVKVDSITNSVKIIGVGDIMLGTNYPSTSYLPKNDGKDLLTEVTPILENADITFGNLEGVILSGDGEMKRCGDPENCYAFKMPDSYVEHLVSAGFDVVSLANNHSNDFGKTGVENTKRLLQKSNIAFAGLSDCPTTILQKNGIKYGFVAFSPNRGTIKINDYEIARELIKTLSDSCDIVIVSFHGGAEGSKHTHITKATEYYLGENRGNPYEFARMVIDAGADVVFGHGPHVTRAIDIYNGRFIAYSLGNFATYGRFNLAGPNGLAPIVELNLNLDGSFISGQIHPCKQSKTTGPSIDPEKKVILEMQSLNQSDLPNCKIQISNSGKITLQE